MQAIILAGGFGTRLQSVVSDVPKPMAPINNRPFLEYMLDELNNYGFKKVVLGVGYKKESIINYFKYKYKNIDILYAEENEPLGTGGCIKNCLKLLDDDYIFVLNGDTMFKIDYIKMAKNNKLSIACKKMNDFDRYGEVLIEKNNLILSFNEKKYVKEGFINGGIYYIPRNIFDNFNLPLRFSMEKDFFEKYISELKIYAYISDEYFIDIGIPDDYKKAQIDLCKKKALFLDRDGVINIDYGHVFEISKFKFTNYIFDICEKYQKMGYLIFVITNQAGISKGIYTLTDFKILTDYMIKKFSERNIKIENVYYCPHKDSDNCECRKPKPGLFLRAIKDYNIEPSESVAIGDKMSDLIAAHEAGIRKLFFKKTKYDQYAVDFEYEVLKELGE